MAHGKPVLLAEALNAGKEVFELAKQFLDKLPPAPDTPAPATLSDAQQLVAERQQAVLHKEPKPKQKKREQTPGEAVFPGARIGGANGNSAYWTLVEEYFRDVTQQDVLNLLSFCIDADEDDALLVPQLGRPEEDAKQPQPPLHLPSTAAATAGKASPSPVPGSAAVGADVDEPKRSSRLSAKAQRRQEFGYSRYSDGMTSSADQYSRDLQGMDAAGPLVPQLSSPYCLLEQLPAADLLLMANVSMLLQQLSITEFAAALGPQFTADGLAALLQQAQQPQHVLAAHDTAIKGAADMYDDGYRGGGTQGPRSSYGSIAAAGASGMYSSGQKPQKSHRQKEKDAAAANAWAGVSAGLGGPQLTGQQRTALIAWLQQQCDAPGVSEGRRGPIATPWSVPVPTAAGAADVAAASAAAVEPVPAAVQCDADAAAADVGQQQQVVDEQQALNANRQGNAAEPAQGSAEAAAAAVPELAEKTCTDVVAAVNGLAADTAHGASSVTTADLQQQPVHLIQQQGAAIPGAVAAMPAAAAGVADLEVVFPADPYEENLARLEADAKKRAERRAAEVARRRLEARLELHPYIKTLLLRPLPAHIADPGWDIQENLLGDDEPDETAGCTAAASAAAGVQSKTTSAAAGKKAATPGVSSTSKATAAGESSGVAGDHDATAEDTAGLPPTGSSGKAGRGNSKSRGRGRGRGGRKAGAGRGGKAAGAGAAGKAAGGASGLSTSTAGAADGRVEERAPSSAAAHAVAAVIAAAASEGSLEEQWSVLDSSSDVLALAPDDEVLAELLTLQGELLQQVAINRARLGVVLQAALDDLPNQKAAQAERSKWEDDIVAYMTAVREARKAAKREKRELERRQAVEEAAAMQPLSPRHTAARAARAARDNSYGRSSLRGGEWVGGSEDLDDDEGVRGVSPAGNRGGLNGQAAGEEVLGADGGPLMDTLSSRDNDDALCSICGEGHSEPPNQILFCERCDVAVHQICYGVDVIPEGEWLCWPCAQYEEQMRRQGVSQAEIRPPRWQLGAGGGGPSGGCGLLGGSRSVKCALCPMQCGAFKQVTDGSKRWVHVVCALWHAETKMPLDVNEPAIVTGMEQMEGRLANPSQQLCQVCRRAVGATVKCSFGHCAATFHPLCGRARGWYLAIRAGGKGGSYLYKAYCAQHSEGQRQKDREALERAAVLAQGIAPVPEVPKPRRGRPPAGAYNLDDYDETAEQQQPDQAAAAATGPVAPAAPSAVNIDPAVLQALAVKEQKIWILQGVRFELETLRMLADQVKRREKVKLQLAKMASEAHAVRLEDPVAGLELLEEDIQEHAAIVAALPAGAAEAADAAAVAEDITSAGASAAAAAGQQQSATPAAAADAATDDKLEQQTPAQPLEQQADASGGAVMPAAPAAVTTEVAPGVVAALDVLHALVGGQSAPESVAAAAAAASPASSEGAPAAEQPVADVAAEAERTQVQQEPDSKELGTASASSAPGAADGDVTVTPAEQQQEAVEPPLIESPTGTASNRGSRKQSAAAAAAGEAAPAKNSTTAGRGKGRPPRQPSAGTKRGRAAVTANLDEQQSVLPEAAAQPSEATNQEQVQAATAATAGGDDTVVPVLVSSSAKRRRTGGAGGGGKRGATAAAAWKGAAAASILDGDAAAAGTAGSAAAGVEGSTAEETAEGEDKVAAAAAQQDAAAADAGHTVDSGAVVPDEAAAAGGTAADAHKAADPAADADLAQQPQQQPEQQAVPPAAGSSRASSRKRARPSDDDQALTTAPAAANTAAAEQPIASGNPDDGATAAGQLSKAPSTASEDITAAAAGSGGGASGSSRRRGCKELRLLKAQLDHSMFQPVEGSRSRRSSRDGGGTAAADAAAAAVHNKPGLSTVAEEDAVKEQDVAAAAAAAAAIAESFAADSTAVGNGPVAVDTQPTEVAEPAAAAVTSPRGQHSGGGNKKQRGSKAAGAGQQQPTSPDGAVEAAAHKSR